jgi:hypothetical protein
VVLSQREVAEVDRDGLNSMRLIVFSLCFTLLLSSQTDTTLRPQSLADWQTMIPAVREALKAQFPEERIEGPYPVGILRPGHVADITGDGVSEALVSFGAGGASTSQLTLLWIEGGKPVVARFKDRAGKIGPMVFVEGASVIHTDDVDLMPQEHSVYAIHYNYGANQKLHQCGGEAYIWNPHSETFDYNPALTRKLTKIKCGQVPKTAG